LPVVPKLNVRPSTRRSNAIAVLQSGQNVTATGTPATTSLTISCQVRIWSGYARALPASVSAITGSRGRRKRASATRTKRGRSSAGIPSLPGPPDWNSRNGTVWRPKSVFQPADSCSSSTRDSGALVDADTSDFRFEWSDAHPAMATARKSAKSADFIDREMRSCPASIRIE
jgi:hypothetical protein